MKPLLALVDISNQNTFAPARVGSIGTLLNFIVPMITFGAAIVFLGMLLMGAFQWIASGDNAENVTKAQKTIQFSIFGLILVILSFFIMRLISWVAGIPNPLPF